MLKKTLVDYEVSMSVCHWSVAQLFTQQQYYFIIRITVSLKMIFFVVYNMSASKPSSLLDTLFTFILYLKKYKIMRRLKKTKAFAE